MEFMRNGWYVACWESDLTERPLERTIIGEPVVVFRGGQGKIGALIDRCSLRGQIPSHATEPWRSHVQS